MKKFIATFALLVVTGFAVSARQQSMHDRQLKVYEQLSLTHGSFGKSELVIREEAAWKQLVAKNATLAKLKVDFSKQMVLVVAEAPRGRGKFLSHVEVRAMFACIPHVSAVLHYSTTPPGEPIFMDLILPNHFIVVERFNGPVEFSEVVHSPWLLQPATKSVDQDPTSREYLKKTIRVEILGKLTYVPPTSGRIIDGVHIMPNPEIAQITANGKTFGLQLPRNLIAQAEKLSGQPVIITGILNGTTVQVTDLKADNTIWLMRCPGPEYVKETTEVEARGRIQTIRVKNINVLDPTGGDEIVEVNLVVNGKTYNLELTPEMWKLAVKLDGNNVILNGILNMNTITVNSLKEMVLEFDNFNRPVAS